MTEAVPCQGAERLSRWSPKTVHGSRNWVAAVWLADDPAVASPGPRRCTSPGPAGAGVLVRCMTDFIASPPRGPAQGCRGRTYGASCLIERRTRSTHAVWSQVPSHQAVRCGTGSGGRDRCRVGGGSAGRQPDLHRQGHRGPGGPRARGWAMVRGTATDPNQTSRIRVGRGCREPERTLRAARRVWLKSLESNADAYADALRRDQTRGRDRPVKCDAGRG